MRKLLFLLLVSACSSPKDIPDYSERYERIINGIQPSLQIEGEEIPTFSIEERLKEKGIPGMSLAVYHDGEIWSSTYGMADVGENRKVDHATMFLAGSISKPVAAIRAHQLVEEGKLLLDGNVNDYLTSWHLPDNEYTINEKVTLRRILNHTAGLTVWGFPGYDNGDEIPSVPDVLDGKGNTDSVRVYKEPGESWMYSGGGYTIIQLMITDVTGESFPTTMQKYVLDPLEMRESTYENPIPKKYHANIATGYRGNGDEVEGKWPIYPEMAAAGLWTTASQLLQYGIEIQRIHQTKEDGILKYETVEEMLTPGMNGHGLGPGVSEYTFGHGGADEGFRAQLTVWKDMPYAVVVMVNSDNGSINREVLSAIAKEFDLPGVVPNIKKVVQKTDENLSMYTGKFNIPDYGELKIDIEDNHLIINGGFLDETIHLAAENDTLFFDRKDGTAIDFTIGEEDVTGFRVQGLEAIRIND